MQKNKIRKRIGDAGEELAALVLEKRGYKIIERNFRCRAGEIDIIAQNAGVIVFCEVKTRTSYSFGSGREAVDYDKRCRIKKCAEIFLSHRGISYDYAELHVIEIMIDDIAESRF